MAVWDGVITESDKEIYRKCGYGGEKGPNFGRNPALVVIDVTYDFVGDKPEPVLKSIERFPMSCGEKGWKAIHHIASLLTLAREKGVPIFYSVAERSLPAEWLTRNPRSEEAIESKIGNDIPKEITPAPKDYVIHKIGPSIFHGTPLINVLTPLQIDTLLCCGTTTSGCVRASIIDAATLGFKVNIIEECTFDRGEVSHKVNLFDMNAKYGSVVSIAAVKDYLSKMPSRA